MICELGQANHQPICWNIPSGKAALFDSLLASAHLEFATKEAAEPAGRQLQVQLSFYSTHTGITMKPPPVGVVACSRVV